MIATTLESQSAFIIDSPSTRRSVNTSLEYDGKNGVDVAAWTRTRPEDGVQETLVMAARLFYVGNVEFTLEGVEGTVKEVLFGDVTAMDGGGATFLMPQTSVAGVIFENA